MSNNMYARRVVHTLDTGQQAVPTCGFRGDNGSNIVEFNRTMSGVWKSSLKYFFWWAGCLMVSYMNVSHALLMG